MKEETFKEKNEDLDMEIKLSGIYVALALLCVMGIYTGSSLNYLEPGLGTSLVFVGWIAFIVLILIAIYTTVNKK